MAASRRSPGSGASTVVVVVGAVHIPRPPRSHAGSGGSSGSRRDAELLRPPTDLIHRPLHQAAGSLVDATQLLTDRPAPPPPTFFTHQRRAHPTPPPRTKPVT